MTIWNKYAVCKVKNYIHHEAHEEHEEHEEKDRQIQIHAYGPFAVHQLNFSVCQLGIGRLL